jgi:hypothetical protein
MDTNVILTIAQAILANTKVLQTLVESLPKEAQAEVAKAVTKPVAAKAAPVAEVVPNAVTVSTVPPVAIPAVIATVTPVVAVAAPVVTATVSPSSAVFANQAEFTAFIMDTYKMLGPIKGAGIQAVLNSVGAKNINSVDPRSYAEVKAGVEALKG